MVAVLVIIEGLDEDLVGPGTEVVAVSVIIMGLDREAPTVAATVLAPGPRVKEKERVAKPAVVAAGSVLGRDPRVKEKARVEREAGSAVVQDPRVVKEKERAKAPPAVAADLTIISVIETVDRDQVVGIMEDRDQALATQV